MGGASAISNSRRVHVPSLLNELSTGSAFISARTATRFLPDTVKPLRCDCEVGIGNDKVAKSSENRAHDANFEGNKNRFTDFSSDEAVDDPNECWNSTSTLLEFCRQSIA